MEKQYNTRVLNKKGTTAEWEEANPVIKDGELIVIVTESGKIRTKIGDGVTAYNNLPFTNGGFVDGITLVQAES